MTVALMESKPGAAAVVEEAGWLSCCTEMDGSEGAGSAEEKVQSDEKVCKTTSAYVGLHAVGVPPGFFVTLLCLPLKLSFVCPP